MVTASNWWKNPLVVFGAVLVGGGGPLAAAYAATSDSSRATSLMWALIAFVFGMGAFFCYLVAWKPRNLYAPSEIPEYAYGKAVYRDGDEAQRETEAAIEAVEVKAKEQLAAALEPMERQEGEAEGVRQVASAALWQAISSANDVMSLARMPFWGREVLLFLSAQGEATLYDIAVKVEGNAAGAGVITALDSLEQARYVSCRRSAGFPPNGLALDTSGKIINVSHCYGDVYSLTEQGIAIVAQWQDEPSTRIRRSTSRLTPPRTTSRTASA